VRQVVAWALGCRSFKGLWKVTADESGLTRNLGKDAALKSGFRGIILRAKTQGIIMGEIKKKFLSRQSVSR